MGFPSDHFRKRWPAGAAVLATLLVPTLVCAGEPTSRHGSPAPRVLPSAPYPTWCPPAPSPALPSVPSSPAIPPPDLAEQPTVETTAAPAEPEFPGFGGTPRLASEAAFSPNMIGYLLYTSRSVTFRYNRAAGPINVAMPGSTSIVNSLIADNNSPLPRDRVGFRYNYFDNSQSVTGFGPPVFDARGVGTAFARTRDYDLHLYTLQLEKAFLDDRFSAELRVPVSTGLSSALDLRAGTVTGPVAGAPPGSPAFGVVETPDQTLGRTGTQFGNLNLILKGLLHQTPCLAVSGGLGVLFPTGDDTTLRVTDFAGGTTQGQATVERVRLFDIDNETWALSPFLAYLHTPTERWFSQGFLQVDVPLNSSTVRYTELTPRGAIGPPLLVSGPTLTPPFAVTGEVSEQTLLHLSWGTGFWLRRAPCNRWLTGVAPTVEVHYTTTLEDADVLALPADGLVRTEGGRLVPEEGPRVGSRRNRVDLLNVTVGSTFQFAERATLATGFSFPLRGEDDRTYDWEFHLQFNYFFGRPRDLPPTF